MWHYIIMVIIQTNSKNDVLQCAKLKGLFYWNSDEPLIFQFKYECNNILYIFMSCLLLYIYNFQVSDIVIPMLGEGSSSGS